MKITNVINLIKQAVLLKKTYLILKNLNFFEKKLLKCLVNINLIHSITYTNSKFLVKINYSGENVIFRKITNLYKTGAKKSITYKFLKKNNWINTQNVYVLSTSFGIITHLEALKYKTGGVLLFKLFN